MHPRIRTTGGAGARTGRTHPQALGGEAAVQVHRELRIGAPAEHVFELARDIEWLPGWNAYMEVRSVSGPLDRVGTTFGTTLNMLGLQFRGRGSVVAAEPRRLVHIRVDCTEYGGTSAWIYRFDPVGGATRCSVDIACKESGTLVILEHVFGRPAVHAALERIAQHLLESLAALAVRRVSEPV